MQGAGVTALMGGRWDKAELVIERERCLEARAGVKAQLDIARLTAKCAASCD